MPYVYLAVLVILTLVVKIYLKVTSRWCRSKRCLVDKTTIITGANAGIGYATALDFSKRGARVILACRDEKRAEEARSKIIHETGNENVVVKIVDLANFASVRRFAEDIKRNEDRLDILVNNAGAGGLGDKRTTDGHLFITQINYLSHFLLTNLLIDLLKKSAPSRVVNVSSMVAKYGSVDVEKLDEFPGPVSVYNNSKLCNVLFTIELARRLEGSSVTSYSLHPGAVQTELFRDAKRILRWIFKLAFLFFKTSEEGAQTTIHAAVANGIEEYSGEHFEECQRVERYLTASDPGLPRKLWKATEAVVGINPGEIKI